MDSGMNFTPSSPAVAVFPLPGVAEVLRGLDFAFARNPEAELWECVENSQPWVLLRSRNHFPCSFQPWRAVGIQLAVLWARCIWDWDGSVPLTLEFHVRS